MPAVLDHFSPPVRTWFERAFGEPTPPQIEGWPPIELKVEGRNLLGTKHDEFQLYPNYRVPVNVYDVGRSVSLSVSISL